MAADPIAAWLAQNQAPAAPAAGGDDPIRAWLAQSQPAPEVAPAPAQPEQEEPGLLSSIGRGLRQGATFGFYDEVRGGLGALLGEGDYTQIRDKVRKEDAAAKEAHPWAFGGGEVAGGLATALVPGLGAAKGLAGAMKAGAKVGAAVGLGTSEADITQGDLGGAVTDTLKGAAGGAVAGAAGHALGKVIARAPERLRERTIKDLAGAQTKTLTTPGLQKGLAANKDNVVNAAQEFGLDALARKPEKLLAKTEEALDVVGERIGEVYKAADAASPGVPIGKVTKALREVAEEYERNPATRQMAKQIRAQIDDVAETWLDTHGTLTKGRPIADNGALTIERALGDGVTLRGVRVPASEVHGFVSELGKRGFAGAGYDPGTLMVMRQRTWGAVKDLLTSHVKEVAPLAADDLAKLNKTYSGLSSIVDAATDRAAKEATRRTFSGVDATLFGASALTGNPLAGLAAVAGKRAVQEGVPMAGRALDSVLAKLVQAARTGAQPAQIVEEGLAAGVPRGLLDKVIAGFVTRAPEAADATAM